MSATATVAPVLVLAVGNPSRGDDALGPEIAARLEATDLSGVEVLVDFQLQVEHALDLVGRQRVIFVDAGAGTLAPFDLAPVTPAAEFLHTSHALSPAAVLAAFVKVRGELPPPAFALCIRGEHFELGAPMSAPARANLAAAWPALLDSCQPR